MVFLFVCFFISLQINKMYTQSCWSSGVEVRKIDLISTAYGPLVKKKKKIILPFLPAKKVPSI